MAIKNDIVGHFKQDYFVSKCISVIIAVCLMGMCVAFMLRINMGADPCSNMNTGISSCLNMSFGNWQLLFNTVLFCLTIYFDRSKIGVGSLANMILVGYSADFTGYILDIAIPQSFWTVMSNRILLLIPILILFIISAAFYMAVDLGSSPYDAFAFILAERFKNVLPFRAVRIIYDIVAMIIGIITGGGFGIVTLVIAFALGPAIAEIQKVVQKIWTPKAA